MVAARQLEMHPLSAAEDLRKHVIRLMQAGGEDTRSNILVLPQVFLEFLDYDHKMALFLNKLLYWTERTKNPDGWVYKTYQDWYAELGFKESVIRRLLHGDASTQTRKRTLTDIGVEVKVKRAPNGSPTCHYRINLDVFLDAIRRFGDDRQAVDTRPENGKFPPWNPRNPQDRTSGFPDFEPPESPATSDQKIPTQTPTEITAAESSTEHEDDLEIFAAYEKRFGRFKAQLREPFRGELARLGTDRVGQVLERCASRGRSWNYVLKALANETAVPAETNAATRWDGYDAADAEEGLRRQQALETAAVPVSGRVQTPWQTKRQPDGTVQDAWDAALQQLELQFGSDFYRWGRGLTLVDFEGNTFTVVARTDYARDLLQHRLNRSVERILGDVYGQPVAVRYLLAEAWAGQGSPDEQIA